MSISVTHTDGSSINRISKFRNLISRSLKGYQMVLILIVLSFASIFVLNSKNAPPNTIIRSKPVIAVMPFEHGEGNENAKNAAIIAEALTGHFSNDHEIITRPFHESPGSSELPIDFGKKDSVSYVVCGNIIQNGSVYLFSIKLIKIDNNQQIGSFDLDTVYLSQRQLRDTLAVRAGQMIKMIASK